MSITEDKVPATGTDERKLHDAAHEADFVDGHGNRINVVCGTHRMAIEFANKFFVISREIGFTPRRIGQTVVVIENCVYIFSDKMQPGCLETVWMGDTERRDGVHQEPVL